MADYIERVKVVGTVDMNTEEAERKLGQLKEPITVRLDVEDKGLFQSIQQDINKIERAVSKIDFSGIGKNLSDEVKKGTEQAVKDIQKFEKRKKDISKQQDISEKILSSAKKNILDGTYSSILDKQENELQKYDKINSEILNKARAYHKEYKNIVKDLEKHYDEKSSTNFNDSELFSKIQRLKILNTSFDSIKKDFSSSTEVKTQKQFDGLVRSFEKADKKLNEIKLKFKNTSNFELGSIGYEQLTSDLKEATKASERFRDAMQDVSTANLNDMEADLKSINNLTNKAGKNFEKFSSSISDLQKKNALNEAKAWGRQNSKATLSYSGEWSNIISNLGSASTIGQYNDAIEQLKSFKLDMKAQGKTGRTYWGEMKDVASRVSQIALTYGLLEDVAMEMPRQIYESVKEVNAAQIELAKVSEASTGQLSTYYDEAAVSAKKYGSSVSDIISSTADWQKLGYNLKDAEKLSNVTTLYQRVGDNMTQETASENLISTLQGFQLDASQATSVIDKFNEVANSFAIGSDGLGEALQRSAASFYTSGTDLSKSIALITGTNTVLQDPVRVGNMWKTVSARLRGADQELIDMGETTEGMVESTSKLRDLVKGTTGFDIMVDEAGTQFKDIYDIVVGIGEKFQEIPDIERAGLLEALAGKNQSNALAAALTNIDTIKQAYQTAEYESVGSAERELANYQKGIEYSLGKFQATFQEFSTTALSSDLAKGIIDTGSGLLGLITKGIGNSSSLETIISAITGGYLTKNGLGKHKNKIVVLNALLYKVA